MLIDIIVAVSMLCWLALLGGYTIKSIIKPGTSLAEIASIKEALNQITALKGQIALLEGRIHTLEKEKYGI
jgi:hypothetical protein